MQKTVLFTVLGLAAMAAHAQAQEPYQPAQPQIQHQPAPAAEAGRVISSTPVIQQVAVPRQVCTQQPVAVQQPTTGAGSVIGAIAGGLLGNTVGHGSGRAAATALGVFGGAVVGNAVEANGSRYPGYAQNCTTQNTYENRTVAYNVTYEYAGRQYEVQMPQDPGQWVQLQVLPVGANANANTSPRIQEPAYDQAPQGEGVPIQRTVGVAPQVVYAAPAAYPVPVVYPAYGYQPYYYPPVGISLGFGYTSGYRGYYGGHGRYR